MKRYKCNKCGQETDYMMNAIACPCEQGVKKSQLVSYSPVKW